MSETVQVSTAVTEFEVAVGDVVLCVRKNGATWDVVPRKPMLAGPYAPRLDNIKSEEDATELAVRYGRALLVFGRASEKAATDLRDCVVSIDTMRREREAS